MNLVRRPVAQAFARPAVELIIHLLHALLAHARQRFALREVLAQEAVGALVGAALPRMVWEREVELDVDVGRDLGMVRELLAEVERDGPERLALKGPRHLLSDAFRGLAPADAAVEAAGVDAAIDGGVAVGAPAQLEREPALYLLGRPLLLQELVPDQVENSLLVERAPPAAREPAPLIAPLRGRGAVEPLARVALELARHRRFAAPDGAGDLGDAPPVASHHHDVLALA